GATRAGGPVEPVRPASERALRWRGPACCDRAGAGTEPEAAALRRADRPPRLRHGRAGALAAREASGNLRVRARRRDPRSRRRVPARAGARAARRPHRPRAGRSMTTLALRGLVRAPGNSLARVLVLA